MLPPLFGRSKPPLKRRIRARAFLLPFVLAMLPIRPCSSGARVPHRIKHERVKPPFAFSDAESVVVNPFEDLQREKFGVHAALAKQARAAPLNRPHYRCGQPLLCIGDRADPQRKRFPFDVFPPRFLKPRRADSQQLPLRTRTSIRLSTSLKRCGPPFLIVVLS